MARTPKRRLKLRRQTGVGSSPDCLAVELQRERTEHAMTTKNLTLDTFESVINSDGIVFVDFWAAWCGPCRAFAPTFERAAELHPDIVFGKVDTEAEQQLAAEFRITSIPTLMIFRDGIMVYTQPGALPATQLDQLIQGARDLDMNDVRRQIAERDAQPAS